MKHVILLLACSSLLSACAAPSNNQQAQIPDQLACSYLGTAAGGSYYRQCIGGLKLTEEQERSID